MAAPNDACCSIFWYNSRLFTGESTFWYLTAWHDTRARPEMVCIHPAGLSFLFLVWDSFTHKAREREGERESERAIGLPLSQRMTPRGTHFPDKWAAVISIGLFGQKCLTRGLFMAPGLEKYMQGYLQRRTFGARTQGQTHTCASGTDVDTQIK